MSPTPFYITTAIPYPNALPHIGTAYEMIGTDAIARFYRLAGYDVFFLTGTDEHSQNVEKAARDCHADGLAGWLVERAQGSLGDRQIFAQMVNKAMPLQVQAQVGGGVQIQLSWLGQRQIGTTVAQQTEQRTQVLDLQAESDGTYRIIDPVTPPAGGGGQAGATDEKGAGGADGA